MARLNNRLPVALRLGDWDAVAAMAAQVKMDGANTANLRALAAELGDYAKGMKALGAGDIASAQAASDSMDAGLWRMHQRVADEKAAKKDDDKKNSKQDQPPVESVMPDAVPDPILKSLSVQSLELRAGILVAENKVDEAKKLYESARAEEKRLGYHEPPMYIRPVGETEAVALLNAKDYPGARSAYESALAQRPNSGFALYGLARVKELQGDAAGAREAFKAFLKAWPNADAELAELAHAKEVAGGESVAAK
jgi:tetratricopeptide (TPR) repeat protein